MKNIEATYDMFCYWRNDVRDFQRLLENELEILKDFESAEKLGKLFFFYYANICDTDLDSDSIRDVVYDATDLQRTYKSKRINAEKRLEAIKNLLSALEDVMQAFCEQRSLFDFEDDNSEDEEIEEDDDLENEEREENEDSDDLK